MTTTPQAALLREAAQNALITLDGIADTNPRDKTDFEDKDEWITWAKSRARWAADALRAPIAQEIHAERILKQMMDEAQRVDKTCATCGFVGQEDPVKGCTNCGSFSHVRNQCPLPSPAKQRNALTPAAQTPPHAALSATQPAQAAQPVSRDVIRDVLLRNGFTVKPGCGDLKPYVYKAANALLEVAAAQPVQGVPEVPQQWFNLLAEARGAAYDEEGYIMDPDLASAVEDIDAALATHQQGSK